MKFNSDDTLGRSVLDFISYICDLKEKLEIKSSFVPQPFLYQWYFHRYTTYYTLKQFMNKFKI